MGSDSRGPQRTHDERGVALLLVLMCTTLLMVLGGGLLLLTMTEERIASHFNAGLEALYAAEAAVERVFPDLLAAPDWDALLDGATGATFVDGPASGTRALGDGTTLDLAVATNLERCGRVRPCSEAELSATTDDRPYGANNPRWQLYAYGPIRDLLPPGRVQSRVYVIVWVAGAPLEDDGEPPGDSAIARGAGRRVLSVRARAYGPYGARRGVEATVARGDSRLRVVAWREL